MTGIEIFNDIVITTLALATFLMAWKTKTLTDVVEEMTKQTTALTNQNRELSEQTTVLTKSYELQNQLTLTDRIPYFKSGTFFRNKNNIEGYVALVNRGLMARNIKIFGPASRKIEFTTTHNSDTVIINDVVTFYFRASNDPHDLQFNFQISFISEEGNEFSQDFKVSEGVVICYPPVVGLTK